MFKYKMLLVATASIGLSASAYAKPFHESECTYQAGLDAAGSNSEQSYIRKCEGLKGHAAINAGDFGLGLAMGLKCGGSKTPENQDDPLCDTAEKIVLDAAMEFKKLKPLTSEAVDNLKEATLADEMKEQSGVDGSDAVPERKGHQGVSTGSHKASSCTFESGHAAAADSVKNAELIRNCEGMTGKRAIKAIDFGVGLGLGLKCGASLNKTSDHGLCDTAEKIVLDGMVESQKLKPQTFAAFTSLMEATWNDEQNEGDKMNNAHASGSKSTYSREDGFRANMCTFESGQAAAKDPTDPLIKKCEAIEGPRAIKAIDFGVGLAKGIGCSGNLSSTDTSSDSKLCDTAEKIVFDGVAQFYKLKPKTFGAMTAVLEATLADEDNEQKAIQPS